MRYAFISDVHANLTALQSVLNDISRQKVDKIICLGDTMGYGPQPVETLELIYQVAEIHLLGNHDAAVCGKLNPIIFSESAKKAVIKHRTMVSKRALKWLESMPLTLKAPDFRCAHGDFSNPGAFKYIISKDDALPSFSATEEQLLFVGHSHLAAIYVIGKSGASHYLPPRDFIMESGKRYIINPGTVGYPRCGKFESTYCIYDSIEKSIVFRHLPFDYQAYNRSLKAAGFDEIPWVKKQLSDLSLPDVRKRLSFTKPLEGEHHLINTLKKIQSTQSKSIKKYRVMICIISLLSLFGGGYLLQHAKKAQALSSLSLIVPEESMPLIELNRSAARFRNFTAAFPASVTSGQPIHGWRYLLENRNTQQIAAAKHLSGNQIVVTHRDSSKFIIESPVVNLSEGELNYVRIKGRIRKGVGFEGCVVYQLISYIQSDDGTLKRSKIDSFEVRGRSNEGPDVSAITRKIKLNKNTTHIRLKIEADFKGILELRQPQLFGHDDTIHTNAEGNIP